MANSELEILVAYLQSHPLVAVALVVLAVLAVGSLLRKLIKLAAILIIVLVAGMYWTREEAAADWRVEAERLRQRAEALGAEALEKGRDLLDEGKAELRRRAEAKDE